MKSTQSQQSSRNRSLKKEEVSQRPKTIKSEVRKNFNSSQIQKQNQQSEKGENQVISQQEEIIDNIEQTNPSNNKHLLSIEVDGECFQHNENNQQENLCQQGERKEEKRQISDFKKKNLSPKYSKLSEGQQNLKLNNEENGQNKAQQGSNNTQKKVIDVSKVKFRQKLVEVISKIGKKQILKFREIQDPNNYTLNIGFAFLYLISSDRKISFNKVQID